MSLISSIRTALLPPTSPPPVEEAKAVVGPGAAMVTYGMPLTEITNNPTQWIRTAQKISHTGWPAVAERIVSGRASAVPWHLEDAEGNTVDDQSPPPYQAVRALIEKPYGPDFTKPTPGGMRLTQRGLWRLTLRHMGVVNIGFWYLAQTEALAGTPLETLYINPARMTPATDSRDNLIGWVLDESQSYTMPGGAIRGIPLSLNEVVPFWLEPPDWGYYGVGNVEIAMAKINLDNAGNRFLTDTFATGGRRGSFIGPKGERMTDDVFDALVAGLRNVAEDPNSAKRNIVAKGPLDITPQASTPTELQAYDVVGMNRDDILGIWGVPLTQTGIPAASGLNSGETRKYDEAVLWQNAIHPRLDVLRETIQVYILDRFVELGVEVKLVLDEPSFDDEAPRFELADKAKSVPLIDNERRALVGHDPWPDYDPVTGEPLGVAVRLPSDIVLAAIGPSEEQRPVTAAPAQLAAGEEEAPAIAKATLGNRDEIEEEKTPILFDRVSAFLAEQRSSVLNRLAENASHLLSRRFARLDTDAIWPRESRRWDLALAAAIVPVEDDIATEVALSARRMLGPNAKADEVTEAAIDYVRTRAGERITEINGTTRKAVIAAVRDVLEEALEEGLGPSEAAARLSERVGSLPAWDRARSELVARTETMFAYNDAALRSYQSYDVTHVQAIDGDYDAVCESRNGQVFTLDEAYGITDHPNGTLDWAPVVGGKAVTRQVAPPNPVVPAGLVANEAIAYRMPEVVINIPPAEAPVIPPAIVHVNVPEQPAPVIHVAPAAVPDIHVAAPDIAPPVIINQPAKAADVVDVRIVDDVAPPKLKRVIRNAKGEIEGVVEGRQ